MPRYRSEVIALSLLAAGEQAHAFSAFLPSRFTIRNWVVVGDGPQMQQNISNLRSGYLPALLFGLGLGAVISWIVDDPLPFIFSAATGGIMVALYEQALPPEVRLGIRSLAPAAPKGAAPCPT